jgi:hypothetical protein
LAALQQFVKMRILDHGSPRFLISRPALAAARGLDLEEHPGELAQEPERHLVSSFVLVQLV